MAMICALLATSAMAAPPGQMGGWHYRSPYGKLYFSGTEVTLQGSVVELKKLVPQAHMMRGTQLIIKTDKGQKSIHLGPHWFIQQQDLNLKVGEQITVIGKSVGQGADEIIFASEIKTKQQTWSLRDREGIPHWCAQRSAATDSVTPQAPDSSSLQQGPLSQPPSPSPELSPRAK
jgi:hypothetical protein